MYIRSQNKLCLIPNPKCVCNREQNDAFLVLCIAVRGAYEKYISPYTHNKMSASEVERYLKDKEKEAMYQEWDIMSNKDYLGTYKTKERALQIMDEIQKTLSHNKFIELTMPLENYSKVSLWQEYTNTYEMPKE